MIQFIVSTLVVVLAILICFRCLITWGASPAKYAKLFIFSSASESSSAPTISTRKIFLYAFVFRISLVLISLVAVMLFSDIELSFQDCLQQLQRWDARHYINLIERGYSNYIEDGRHLFLVFFPAYVWIVRFLTLIIPNTIVAGTLVSCFCYACACCYIYKLTREFFSTKVARDTLFYLSVFPFSFFFGTVMTESLFLLATAAACYYAWKRKWILFSVFGLLAALTRMTGVLVIIFAVVVLLESERVMEPPVRKSISRSWKNLVRRLPALFSPALGTATYLALNYYVDNDPFAFVTHQAHWHQGSMWVADVIKYLTEYFATNINSSFGWAAQFPAIVIFTAGIFLLFLSVRKMEYPPSFLVYAFCYLIANFSLSWLLSAGRYLSCCFFFSIFLARLTENKPALRVLLLHMQSILLGIYLCAYIGGAQVM